MKKLKFIFKMLLFAALVAPWASCSKSDDNAPDDGKNKDPYMEVCEHVADVANQVDVYFDQSKSIEDLSQHLDDIKKIPYVEDAYTTSTTLFVKIKDYGKIHYSIYPAPETYTFDSEELLSKARRKAPSNNLIEHQILGQKSICIANAQYVELELFGEKWDRNYIANETKSTFDALGYDAQLINHAGLDFFSETMYDYDIVFLIAHGHYETDTNLHWFDGNEEVNVELEDIYKKEDFKLTPEGVYMYKDYPEDHVALSKYKYTDKGNKWNPFDNQIFTWWDVAVSEKFIANSQKKISDEKWGKPIFFSVPCQSLMGNDNMGQAFLDKGFGAYYGYTESNYWGQRAYFDMLNNLLSGMSLENAYNALPIYYKDEWRTTDQELLNSEDPPKASLRHLPKDSKAEIYKSCIIKPIIEKPTDASTDNKIQIHLSGKAPFWSYSFEILSRENEKGEMRYWPGKTQSAPSSFGYGFYISETPNYKNAYQVCFLSSADENNWDYNSDSHLISFYYDLTYNFLNLQNLIVPGKDYYVWSYIYDGQDTYLSNMESFTTRVNAGGGSIPNIPGTNF